MLKKRQIRHRGVRCVVLGLAGVCSAVLLAQDADYIDLDGPLLLARDRMPALSYSGNMVSPPRAELWG